MQSENIVQENDMLQTKPNQFDTASPITKQIQASEDKTLISHNMNSSNDQSVLGKRLCTEREGGSSPVNVSGDRSPFSDPQQNISASYGNSANTSYDEDQANGGQAEEAEELA